MKLSRLFAERNVLLLLYLSFGIFLIHRIVLIFYPHPDAGGVENNVTWFIQRLLDDQPLYTNTSESPYSIAQYSPLYYYLCAAIGKLFAVKPDDVLNVFILSRIVSLAFNLLYVYMIALTCKKVFNCSRSLSIATGLFSFLFLEIISFSRVDSLNQLSFMTAFYFAGRWLNKEASGQSTTKWFGLTIIFSVIAFFSKQSSIVFPIIVCLWLIQRKQFKQLFLYCAGYGILLIIGIAVLCLDTGLTPLYQNTILGINNGVSWGWYWANIVRDYYLDFGLLWLIMAIGVLGLMNKDTRPLYKFTSLSIIISFLLANLFCLKWGSHKGYFTEWWTIVFMSAAAYSKQIGQAFASVYEKWIPASISFLLLLKVVLIIYPLWNLVRPGARQNIAQLYKQESELAVRVKQRLNENPGHTVFANMYAPDSYLNNILFRDVVLPQYDIVIYAAWHQSFYDFSQFKQGLKDGTIKYVISKKQSALQFMELPLDKYQAIDSLYNYRVYEYKP